MTREEEWLLQEKYHGVETEAFFADVTRLNNGEPLAYIIGHVPFMGTTIYLDSKPLIPRVETEYLVEMILKTTPQDASIRALDLFAGSGCVGVSLLKQRPSLHVIFAELYEKHFETITKNIQKNYIDERRARIVQSDVWNSIDDTFDLIVANPPYISKKRNTVDTAVSEFEPPEALFADNDGFSYIEKFIAGIPTRLHKTGRAWVEHEPFHSAHIVTCAEIHGLNATPFKDQYDVDRFTRLSLQ